MKMRIDVSLSIERSLGADNLAIVRDKLDELLRLKFPDADITVRKGYFATIDGIFSTEPSVEPIVRTMLAEVRQEVLS